MTTPVARALSETHWRQYRSDGFVVLPAFFNASDLQAVTKAIEELTARALESKDYGSILELEPESLDGRPVVRRVYHPFEQHPAFRALAAHDGLLECVETLLGPDLVLQHSKLNMKPPRVGSPVHWHQDLVYFPHTNDDLCTVLIYLDDATEENGCLQVLPGQHRRYLDHSRPDGAFAGLITEPIETLGRAIPLPAPPGSAILMHALLPHRSLPNRSSTARRTLIFEYRAADAFPIFYGERTAQDESHTVHLRGQPVRTARFGGPAPTIPLFASEGRSLYQIQAETLQERRSRGLQGR